MKTRVAVIKPDYGVSGGFEILLDRLVGSLKDDNDLDISAVSIPGKQTPRPIWGQPDAASRWYEHPDFFNYLGMVHDTRQLDLSQFDLIISTQPPSFLAPHDRILGLFYHQSRIFYELADAYVSAGFADSTRHAVASECVQEVDGAHLGGVAHWLAGSHECANRLIDSWDPSVSISLLDAPPLSLPSAGPTGSELAIDFDSQAAQAALGGPVLCVSRHEWPKRTELVVAAAHLGRFETQLIGGGGRLAHVKRLDHEISTGIVDPGALGSHWLGAIAPTGTGATTRRVVDALLNRMKPQDQRLASPVTVLGATSDADRNQAYRDASLMVAPAFREDYGLTALEAMVWGCPVVVCSDGGGLVEIVEATGGGIVVAPTAEAIAEGVMRIQADPVLAQQLRAKALAVNETHTWERAHSQLRMAIESALGR